MPQPKKYANPAERTAAYRRRLRGEPEPTPVPDPQPEPELFYPHGRIARWLPTPKETEARARGN